METGDHGLPVIPIGATTPREVLNQAFAALEEGIWKRGNFAARPSLSGDTTPGQWFFAEDVNAIFYDTGSAWILIHAFGERTLADGLDPSLYDVQAYDRTILIDASGGDVALDAAECAFHEGHLLTVRRIDSSAIYDATITLTIGATSGTILLPSFDDEVVLLGESGAWRPVSMKLSHPTSEVWTGELTEGGAFIYEKLIEIPTSTLSSGSSSVAHGITGLDDVLSLTGMIRDATTRIPLPHALNISVSVGNANIDFVAGSSFTTFSGWVRLRYTKT